MAERMAHLFPSVGTDVDLTTWGPGRLELPRNLYQLIVNLAAARGETPEDVLVTLAEEGAISLMVKGVVGHA